MNKPLKKIIFSLIPIIDIIFSIFTLFSSLWFRLIRKTGIHNFPISKKIFFKIGVFPIIDQYYEPMFNPKHLDKNRKRNLPGIDLNISEQLSLLRKFKYRDELKKIPLEHQNPIKFYYKNPSFFSGDAEFLYSIIRHYKPKRIIEIGSGYSTLMMLEAIAGNKLEQSDYICDITCIEPYEMPWLEETGVKVIRKKVQDLDIELFKDLNTNDLLFIDSSHIIRPQGDVLFEYLEVLPILNKGTLIHIHDIFTPYDYLPENFEKYIVFINEQYLVEAFLNLNKDFRIIGALNYLKNNHFQDLTLVAPTLETISDAEPRSLWLIKN